MIDTMKYSVQVRAHARLVDAGRKEISDCREDIQVQVCVVLIVDHEWEISNIPEHLKESVLKEMQ